MNENFPNSSIEFMDEKKNDRLFWFYSVQVEFKKIFEMASWAISLELI